MSASNIFQLKTLKIYALSIIIVSFSACGFNCITVEGTGPVVSKTFEMEMFNEIESDIPATINITQGDKTAISASGQQNILDLLELKVKGKKLIIDFKQDCVKSNFDSLIINISIIEIASIELNGSGAINTVGKINCKDLDLDISGSGTIHASINSENKVSASIGGSGKLFINGSSEKADFDISGSGEIHALEFNANSVSADISGAGTADVNAIEKIDADISGSGVIQYKGNPKVKSSLSGSGQIKRIE